MTIPDTGGANLTEMPQRARRSIALALFLAGLGIGWLMGLSTSPVAAATLPTLLGAGAAIVTAATALRQKQAGSLQGAAWGLAMLALGVATAVPIGIKVRESGRLGSARAVVSVAGSVADSVTPPVSIGLFGTKAATQCADLLTKTQDELNGAFLTSPSPLLKRIGSLNLPAASLVSLREAICDDEGLRR